MRAAQCGSPLRLTAARRLSSNMPSGASPRSLPMPVCHEVWHSLFSLNLLQDVASSATFLLATHHYRLSCITVSPLRMPVYRFPDPQVFPTLPPHFMNLSPRSRSTLRAIVWPQRSIRALRYALCPDYLYRTS